MNRSYPALRGVAILLVIVNHSIHMALKYAALVGPVDKDALIHQILVAFQALGALAVPIFLFLSGCFFAYAANKGDWRANYRVVWVNLKHVLIPYLIWSVVFYIEVLVFHGRSFSLLGWIKNFLVGYPFNFVPLLAFFYLISPILVRLMRRAGWWVVIGIGVYQLLLVWIDHPGAIGFEAPDALRLLAPPVLTSTLAGWAIYFPIGLMVALRGVQASTWMPKARWLLAALTVGLYVVTVFDATGRINFLLARMLTPLPFILLAPTFQRSKIPMVRPLELVGKRAYGLYLTNLITLDLALLAVQAVAPGLLVYYWLLVPPLMAIALCVPYFGMGGLERLMKPVAFRYAFG